MDIEEFEALKHFESYCRLFADVRSDGALQLECGSQLLALSASPQVEMDSSKFASQRSSFLKRSLAITGSVMSGIHRFVEGRASRSPAPSGEWSSPWVYLPESGTASEQ